MKIVLKYGKKMNILKLFHNLEFSIRKFVCFIKGHKTERIEMSNPSCELYQCKRCGECFDCN